MHKVVEHIDRCLDQPLDLVTLAEVAHFSPYHFHRLFAAWMGETLGDYLRRRRVEVAAMRLASQPRLSVLSAAVSVGFGSGEAFARAFKLRFGCSPTAWRAQNRNPDQAQRNRDQAELPRLCKDGISRTVTPETSMNVSLVDRAPAEVAYLRYTGPYGAPIAAFWTNTVAPWMAENALFGHPRYGISHDDPSITDPSRCRYDCPSRKSVVLDIVDFVLPWGQGEMLDSDGPRVRHFVYASRGVCVPQRARRVV